jgi:hypothetical protein
VRVAVSPRHVLRNGRLTHRDLQLLQFPWIRGRTPERIRGGHSTNQRADLGGRGWTTRTVPTLPRPDQAEPASAPGEHGVRLDENKRRPPTAPRLRQARPKHAICRGQTKPRGPSDSGPPTDAGARGFRGGEPRAIARLTETRRPAKRRQRPRVEAVRRRAQLQATHRLRRFW